MKHWLLTTLLLIGTALPLEAQQISVEEFRHIKKPLFHRKKVKTDRKLATLDLTTNEKGFVIKANGTDEVKPQESDGKLTLLLPHKTRFLVIKHPDYGQTFWKVPGKPLKRKKRYQAYLRTSSPKKHFRPDKQWVVFNITPENAILHIDSLDVKVRNGRMQCYLPLGTHGYKVESPFHQAVEDSLVLNDSVRTTVTVILQPFYSYLTVKTPSDDYTIYIDDQLIGNGEATSGHLSPGMHQLTVGSINSERVYYYDQPLMLGAAEKRTIEISADRLKETKLLALRTQPATTPTNLTNTQIGAVEKAVQQPVRQSKPSETTDVTLLTASDTTEIWMNQELLSVGPWTGKLERGFYMLTTHEGEMVSAPVYFWVDNSFPVTVNLGGPQQDYGLLNIHSNVIDADIFINNVRVGVTPCVISNLPTGHDYEVTLRKQGYHSNSRTVMPRGNDLLDVEFIMKKQ